MKLEPRYRDLPFTRQQVDKVGDMLGLKDHEQSLKIANFITAALYECLFANYLQVPNVRAATRRLSRIASLSRHLATLLEEEPAALDLMRPLNQVDSDLNGLIARYEQETRRLQELVQTLARISHNATKIRPKNLTYRTMGKLLPLGLKADTKKAPVVVSRELWPLLFEIWELSGRSITTDKDGVREFVAFIHEVVGLKRPATTTFDEAITRWITENPKRRLQGFPPRLRTHDID
jgi:hypothetical protein